MRPSSNSSSVIITAISESRLPIRLLSFMFAEPQMTVLSSEISNFECTYINSVTGQPFKISCVRRLWKEMYSLGSRMPIALRRAIIELFPRQIDA